MIHVLRTSFLKNMLLQNVSLQTQWIQKICQFSSSPDSLVTEKISLSDITAKCVMLPHKHGFVVMPQMHYDL